ncbi:UNVERIFIED_CONTAM: hypothetical protein RF648_17900 [Kocuria sp. CPCC 205274]|uniref:SNF2 N-terminal domain-containing protein n=1 Tax=Herbiconiux daphne TaxID=2970914 RepID=A0ABT2H9C2_9MICO|nr:hypothetical protein [Herbiconiux daphne]MCS5736487.1 hypothetical protein [Herbiconiux daphne]
MIIDESQYLKSRKSKIGKWGALNAKLCGGVLLLSGTPQNAFHDLYNQMVMLGMDMKYSEFENEFCEIKEVKLPTAR